jgi:hypothetical protein
MACNRPGSRLTASSAPADDSANGHEMWICLTTPQRVARPTTEATFSTHRPARRPIRRQRSDDELTKQVASDCCPCYSLPSSA